MKIDRGTLELAAEELEKTHGTGIREHLKKVPDEPTPETSEQSAQLTKGFLEILIATGSAITIANGLPKVMAQGNRILAEIQVEGQTDEQILGQLKNRLYGDMLKQSYAQADKVQAIINALISALAKQIGLKKKPS